MVRETWKLCKLPVGKETPNTTEFGSEGKQRRRINVQVPINALRSECPGFGEWRDAFANALRAGNSQQVEKVLLRVIDVHRAEIECGDFGRVVSAPREWINTDGGFRGGRRAPHEGTRVAAIGLIGSPRDETVGLVWRITHRNGTVGSSVQTRVNLRAYKICCDQRGAQCGRRNDFAFEQHLKEL